MLDLNKAQQRKKLANLFEFHFQHTVNSKLNYFIEQQLDYLKLADYTTQTKDIEWCFNRIFEKIIPKKPDTLDFISKYCDNHYWVCCYYIPLISTIDFGDCDNNNLTIKL